MSLEPSIDDLIRHVDSKYTMVVVAAKRARRLLEGATPTVEPRFAKPVTIALEELVTGKLKYHRTKQGIK